MDQGIERRGKGGREMGKMERKWIRKERGKEFVKKTGKR